MALPPVSLSPPSWAAASLLFALAFPLAGLALAKALEATFLNEFSGFPFGCFHGRLIAHLGHEQRGERKKRSRSRRAKGKPDGTGRVSSWAEAEGRPDETRDRGKRRRARTWETRGASLARTKDSSTRRVRGGSPRAPGVAKERAALRPGLWRARVESPDACCGSSKRWPGCPSAHRRRAGERGRGTRDSTSHVRGEESKRGCAAPWSPW